MNPVEPGDSIYFIYWRPWWKRLLHWVFRVKPETYVVTGVSYETETWK